MNRRGFLSLFGVTAAAIAADPERLLWTPGAKLISIPMPVLPKLLITNWPITPPLKIGDTIAVRVPIRFAIHRGGAWIPGPPAQRFTVTRVHPPAHAGMPPAGGR